MTAEMIFVAAMIVIMLLLLLFEVMRADFTVFSFLVIFLLTGVISTEQALSGFSNVGMLTVLLLFIVAGAIQKHGIIENFVNKILRDSKSPRKSMFKLLAPVAFASGFLNNTPIVVTLTPIIKNWCQKNDISPSKFLIPLSYMTILGGTVTLIGTSTTLIVHGLLVQAGLDGFSFFQLSVVGVPITIFGLIYILTVGYALLPSTLGAKEQIREEVKEFLAEAVIEKDFDYIGSHIIDASGTSFKNVYIIEIIRGEERIFPVTPTTVIREGDQLLFSGTLNTIAEIQKQKGVNVNTGTNDTLESLNYGDNYLVEAVISHQSSMVAHSLKSSMFRNKYNAGVIAVHRNNERIKSRVGDIIMKPGDTLLMLCGQRFLEEHLHSSDFYVVTSVTPPESLKQSRVKGWIAISLLLAMVSSVTFGLLTMFEAMLIAVIILLAFRLIDAKEAFSYIQVNVLLLIASAFGVGAALTQSGLAQLIAESMVDFGRPFGIIGIIIILYIVTNIFTELITNSAAAVLMFPIALEIAEQMNTDYVGFIVLIAVASSASFITPIGYQTNLIVYGPGGYKFTDYIKVGVPLSTITMITATFIIYTVWF
ncbi:SLC13 family permease [Salinicoccus halodurans]|uniref:Di-and tricarboxylate transporter n=1 Tax=Salinicoccus halodurans TaxID=407035 RepID=A0A0F7HJ48_9STAP|nr:SLC13 family permease [Salinicoccus halodurans]AKG73602.1 potassium transporter TrkA [Salinicoccus halodurans]SFK53234.1 Di-and tricarboxylate transporter [Salinicoccus halodurans]